MVDVGSSVGSVHVRVTGPNSCMFYKVELGAMGGSGQYLYVVP